MKVKLACASMLAAWLLCACGVRPADDAGAGAVPAPQEPAFLAENAQWREQRRADLLRPDGWASLVGLHWLELKAHYVGSDATNGIRLAKGPGKLGMVQQEGGRVFFVPERGVALTLDSQPVKGRFELLSDQSQEPGVLGFDDGKGLLTLIERGGRKALRVKHAEADTLTGFGPLEYWPADGSWRIDARFVPHPVGKTMEIMDITGQLQPLPNPGVLEFERDGVPYRLEALDGGEGGFFLVFADRTSGHETYGAGRYLYTGAPDAQGRVAIDFNRAYNPPCAFSAYATCPLPPPDNRLDLAVSAGEKKYLKP